MNTISINTKREQPAILSARRRAVDPTYRSPCPAAL